MRLSGRGRPRVEKLREAGDLDGLLAALAFRDVVADVDGPARDRGASVRLSAVAALADFDGPAKADGLVAALSDPHPAVRSAAVKGLGNLEISTIEPLLDGVATWDAPPYGEAIENAVEVLAGSSEDQVPEALVHRLIHDDSAQLRDWHPEALDLLVSADPRGEQAWSAVAEYLVHSIENAGEAAHRERAEEILGWLGSSGADPVLAALARGRSEPALARAAGELCDARALEPLIRMLNRPDPQVRAAAATALGKVLDTRAVPSLLTATQDPEVTVRAAASEALDAMGTAAVVFGLASLSSANGGELPAAGTGALEPASWAQRVVARLSR